MQLKAYNCRDMLGIQNNTVNLDENMKSCRNNYKKDKMFLIVKLKEWRCRFQV